MENGKQIEYLDSLKNILKEKFVSKLLCKLNSLSHQTTIRKITMAL